MKTARQGLEIKRWEHYAALLATSRLEMADIPYLEVEDFLAAGQKRVSLCCSLAVSCAGHVRAPVSAC
jgi:hypothetical protein